MMRHRKKENPADTAELAPAEVTGSAEPAQAAGNPAPDSAQRADSATRASSKGYVVVAIVYLLGIFMGAIDIGRFVDLETFKARTDAMYDELKAAPTAPGFREIMIPGEIEFHLTRQAEREGIDISPAIEQDFADLAARYGVPLELLQSC